MLLKSLKSLIKLWQNMEMELRVRTLLRNFYLWISYSCHVAELISLCILIQGLGIFLCQGEVQYADENYSEERGECLWLEVGRALSCHQFIESMTLLFLQMGHICAVSTQPIAGTKHIIMEQISNLSEGTHVQSTSFNLFSSGKRKGKLFSIGRYLSVPTLPRVLSGVKSKASSSSPSMAGIQRNIPPSAPPILSQFVF